jgi:hypothetical protein
MNRGLLLLLLLVIVIVISWRRGGLGLGSRAGLGAQPRFMGSGLFLFELLSGHEPGVFPLPCPSGTLSPARCIPAAKSGWGEGRGEGTFSRFMGSAVGKGIVRHWGRNVQRSTSNAQRSTNRRQALAGDRSPGQHRLSFSSRNCAGSGAGTAQPGRGRVGD